MQTISTQMARIYASAQAFMDFFTKSTWATSIRTGGAALCDFVTGNPYQMPLPQISDALARAAIAKDKDWFAYKMSEPPGRAVVAASLSARIGVAFETEDLHLTTGGFSSLLAALRCAVDPGDEVIVITPCFFFYEAMILAAGGTPVWIPARPTSFDLDLDAIGRALGPKTRAILINTPHNPSGRIYPAAQLRELAGMLERASQTHGHRVYLIADEAFSRIIYRGERFESPSAYYPHTFVCYTYGKTLLIPGERVGFVAVPKSLPESERLELRDMLPMALAAHGWSFPNATVQLALPELEPLCVDLDELELNRDAIVAGLTRIGYEVHRSQGTFFVLARSPWSDDVAFANLLTRWNVYVLPASLAKLPGWLRISMTVKHAAIAAALPGFEAALAHARATAAGT